MNDIAAGLRDAADLAERAAVMRQHTELRGPRGDPAVIACLQMAADILRHAAEPLAPPPVATRMSMIDSALLVSIWVLSCTGLLLAAPDPARPLVLAATLAGSGVLSKVVYSPARAIRDGRTARRLARAVDEPPDVRHAVTELRAGVRTLTEALEPDRYDSHVEVGRRMRSVDVWLDGVDEVLAQTSQW